ncbi:uncharacterized protein LOC133481884 [Phyllopteryx taeniolatus]|uniref:uncharacterized protein LOC133481884 n=1 Tax=Phyllopteryx taeniolatus TaxID=161469 RepID=UPI002AD3722A|nr:uncharacterized protein LOC133481884 [Phyllopteryx taeniolatus]
MLNTEARSHGPFFLPGGLTAKRRAQTLTSLTRALWAAVSCHDGGGALQFFSAGIAGFRREQQREEEKKKKKKKKRRQQQQQQKRTHAGKVAKSAPNLLGMRRYSRLLSPLHLQPPLNLPGASAGDHAPLSAPTNSRRRRRRRSGGGDLRRAMPPSRSSSRLGFSGSRYCVFRWARHRSGAPVLPDDRIHPSEVQSGWKNPPSSSVSSAFSLKNLLNAGS